MRELISKEQAMAYPLSYEHYDKVHGSIKFINGVESYRDYIDGLPTVEERKHGHWIYDSECECYYCSNCGAAALNNYRGLSTKSEFCPNCGAIMNEDSEDD